MEIKNFNNKPQKSIKKTVLFSKTISSVLPLLIILPSNGVRAKVQAADSISISSRIENLVSGTLNEVKELAKPISLSVAGFFISMFAVNAGTSLFSKNTKSPLEVNVKVSFYAKKIQTAKSYKKFTDSLHKALKNVANAKELIFVLQETKKSLIARASTNSRCAELNKKFDELENRIRPFLHFGLDKFLENKKSLSKQLQKISDEAIKNLKIKFDAQKPEKKNETLKEENKIDDSKIDDSKIMSLNEFEKKELTMVQRLVKAYCDVKNKESEYMNNFVSPPEPADIPKNENRYSWGSSNDIRRSSLNASKDSEKISAPNTQLILEQIHKKFFDKYKLDVILWLEEPVTNTTKKTSTVDLSELKKHWDDLDNILKEIKNDRIKRYDFYENGKGIRTLYVEEFEQAAEEAVKNFEKFLTKKLH